MFSILHVMYQTKKVNEYKKPKLKIYRRQQGSNLRGRSPTNFKSVSLTTRTYRLLIIIRLTHYMICIYVLFVLKKY